MIAAKNNCVAVGEALLEGGANPNLRENGTWYSETPLMAAGANIHARYGFDGTGATALC
jgi:ankyrin repeat protein